MQQSLHLDRNIIHVVCDSRHLLHCVESHLHSGHDHTHRPNVPLKKQPVALSFATRSTRLLFHIIIVNITIMVMIVIFTFRLMISPVSSLVCSCAKFPSSLIPSSLPSSSLVVARLGALTSLALSPEHDAQRGGEYERFLEREIQSSTGPFHGHPRRWRGQWARRCRGT